MAIEGIASDLARLHGYHTEIRVPYIKADSTKNSPGDIDVLGINQHGETIAIECKAFGEPYAYPNWNTERRTSDIRGYIEELVHDCGDILDTRFEHVDSIDEIWIVFKGFFASEEDPRRTVVKRSREAFTNELEAEFGVSIRLLPSHVLIQELIETVAIDMDFRRRRYASPAMEMVRHLCAVALHRPEEISTISDSLMEISDRD